MRISKRDSSDIFNGCLSHIRDNITTGLPEGQNWYEGHDARYLIGTKTVYDVHGTPWSAPPAWFDIYINGYYIFPVAYSLMGRRDSRYKANFLKGWELLGRNIQGKWKLLSNYSNKQFAFAEVRTYLIEANESFNAFKLNMTEADSSGTWALCPGQIEIFGDIYTFPYTPNQKCSRGRTVSFINHLMIYITVLMTSN